jgi:DNA polymerase-3 subunit gamma/tau
VCSACTEINEGRFVDLIEVDAASRTKVDETRELLDNVQYAPTRGRYKVYLIDEVHMFSNHSFNALLKTLEEPPPHVKFLLATTDPQKLPVTILSRCLQFNLKRLPIEQIRGHLSHVLAEEGIQSDEAALTQLSRAADGSMRDALSLLDQAIAYGSGNVQADEVRAMLGTIEQDHVIDLLKLLAASDAPGLLARVTQLAEHTPDFSGVLAEMISTLHRVALAQAAPGAIDDGFGDRDAVLALAEQLSPEDVQLYYQIGLIGRRDLPLAPDPRSGFEMVLLRMLAFRPQEGGQTGAQGNTPPVATARPAGSPAQAAKAAMQSAPAQASSPAPSAAPAAPATQAAAAPAAAPAPSGDAGDWESIVAGLKLVGMNRQLAINCALDSRDGNRWQLSIAPEFQQLLGKSREDTLAAALSEHLGQPVQINIRVTDQAPAATPAGLQQARDDARLQDAQQAIENDSTVQAFKEAFDARVQPNSVQPVD